MAAITAILPELFHHGHLILLLTKGRSKDRFAREVLSPIALSHLSNELGKLATRVCTVIIIASCGTDVARRAVLSGTLRNALNVSLPNAC